MPLTQPQISLKPISLSAVALVSTHKGHFPLWLLAPFHPSWLVMYIKAQMTVTYEVFHFHSDLIVETVIKLFVV